MKQIKYIGVICCLCLCFFTGCSASKYKEAVELFEKEEYSKAMELFAEISDYEDSKSKVAECKYYLGIACMDNEEWESAIDYFKDIAYKDSLELLKHCEREKGMHENSDYEFLSELEKSILDRMESANQSEVDQTQIVNKELVYIEKFKDATFYDDVLKEIAESYIYGLYVQRDALAKEYYYEYQIEWQRGMVIREDALYKLYNDYNFMTDNKDFVTVYIVDYGDSKKLLTAYETIEADLDAQLKGGGILVEWDEYRRSVSFTLQNNTQYTYDTVFEFDFVDGNNTLIESDNVYIRNIKPYSSFVVTAYISNFYNVKTYYYHNYYEDVKY